jgi:endonuclease YncB( thermonuclease family)
MKSRQGIKITSAPTPTDQQSYITAEIEAIAAKLGLWWDVEKVLP